MTSRPRLTSSIPFWVLLVTSLVTAGIGAWMLIDRLAKIEQAIVTQSVNINVEVYVGQPTAIAGAIVLGAGVVGLLLTLTVAAASSLIARPVEVVEQIDWSTEPAEQFTSAPTATTAAPVISEAPDVEVASDTPAPARATHDAPVIDTGTATDAAPTAAPEDDKRV